MTDSKKRGQEPTAFIYLTNGGFAIATNFKMIGDLMPEKSDWWSNYCRALEAAQRDFDKRTGKP